MEQLFAELGDLLFAPHTRTLLSASSEEERDAWVADIRANIELASAGFTSPLQTALLALSVGGWTAADITVEMQAQLTERIALPAGANDDDYASEAPMKLESWRKWLPDRDEFEKAVAAATKGAASASVDDAAPSVDNAAPKASSGSKKKGGLMSKFFRTKKGSSKKKAAAAATLPPPGLVEEASFGEDDDDDDGEKANVARRRRRQRRQSGRRRRGL